MIFAFGGWLQMWLRVRLGTILKGARVRVLCHFYEVKEVVSLVDLVVEESGFCLDIAYITPIHFFIESTQSYAAVIFAKV